MQGMAAKARVLLVGAGGVGTIAALNLESGGLAAVTAVLRSNFDVVSKQGFNIKSCDHGHLEGWKPSTIVSRIPEMTDGAPPFDFLVCTTKNVADVKPTIVELISPAVTPGHTVIVLIQNGLNIEKPVLASFPTNIVLSGVSMIGSHETSPGEIDHDFPDEIYIGAFRNPRLTAQVEDDIAKKFVDLYSAGKKTNCKFDPIVGYSRWRKLVYNACLNSVCAITGLDTGRIRLAGSAVQLLVRPAMEEIKAAASASGYELPSDIVETMIEVDPLDMYLPPSMLDDIRKGSFIEHENILGEPLREGEKLGVPMPTLRVLYGLCQALQWRTKEGRGLVDIPEKRIFS